MGYSLNEGAPDEDGASNVGVAEVRVVPHGP